MTRPDTSSTLPFFASAVLCPNLWWCFSLFFTCLNSVCSSVTGVWQVPREYWMGFWKVFMDFRKVKKKKKILENFKKGFMFVDLKVTLWPCLLVPWGELWVNYLLATTYAAVPSSCLCPEPALTAPGNGIRRTKLKRTAAQRTREVCLGFPDLPLTTGQHTRIRNHMNGLGELYPGPGCSCSHQPGWETS